MSIFVPILSTVSVLTLTTSLLREIPWKTVSKEVYNESYAPFVADRYMRCDDDRIHPLSIVLPVGLTVP